jgi:spermidine synthase
MHIEAARDRRQNGTPFPTFPAEITKIPSDRKRLLFEFFFLSGFCGLLYQVVWLRLAFASFGIITPVISVVISVFMLGLALGSLAGGRFIAPLTRRTGVSAIYYYALAELLIGVGAVAVPHFFDLGESFLAMSGETNSFRYLSLSGIAIALSIVPFSFAMGVTYPFVMAYVREQGDGDAKSFSHLYLANVIGASLGALLTAVLLVELLGFRNTLWVAGTFNLLIAVGAFFLGRRGGPARTPSGDVAPQAADMARGASIPWVRSILFATGLASLAMEVVWTRTFAPVLGTQVYSFAALLVVYLVATWIGSFWYRRHLAKGSVPSVGNVLLIVAVTAFLPILLNDPRATPGGVAAAVFALASIFPFCAALGYLTPRLIDDFSRGQPFIAGRAYAINALGCILGPLLASYVLLPLIGGKHSLIILALPLLALAYAYRRELSGRWRAAGAVAAGAVLASSLFIAVSYENPCLFESRECEVRRDYTATVVALGAGMQKRLLVNGVGITHLTPITKYMAHLPLAFHPGKPVSALVICFGMGTTYRSLLSWDLETTAVELVPSVWKTFPFFHGDADAVMRNPKGHVVIDDGRRFLDRTRDTFDVVVVDPPPPIEAAGSSLLYSREFHEAVRSRLKPGGVFQTWFPVGEEAIVRAIAKSLADVFPHVKVYRSVEGWGFHFLASMQPLPELDADTVLARMPAAAKADLAEWSRPPGDLRTDIATVLGRQLPIARVLPAHPGVIITDDRPYNEYFLLRRWMAPAR